ncbi:MAG: mechanosensitive ion channel [Planctomycetaceae bacterium]|nr:mechanosensitive ion channel [Planctomycetaceae bacterium]
MASLVASATFGVLLAATPSFANDDVLPFVDEAPMSVTTAEEKTVPSSTDERHTPKQPTPTKTSASVDEPAPLRTPDEAPVIKPTGKTRPHDASHAHARVSSAAPNQSRNSTSSAGPTKAEQINGLRQTNLSDQQRLDELRAGMSDPQGEFHQAEAEFREADRVLQYGKKRIEALTAANKTADAAALKPPFDEADAAWRRARERFDLAIQTRETTQAKMASLERKIQQDAEALERLTTIEVQEPQAAIVTTASTTPAEGGEATDGSPTASGMAMTAAGVPASVLQAADTAPADGASARAAGAKKPSKELAHAQASAVEKSHAADEAEREAESVADRMRMLDTNIELQQKLLAGERRRRDLANESQRALEKDYRAKSLAGAPRAELEALAGKVQNAEDRFDAAIVAVREGAEALDQMQSERAVLQAHEMAAMSVAVEKRREAQDAQGEVDSLQNPFTPRNVLQWCIDHGPKLLAILVGMLLLQIVSKVFSRRIVMMLARGGPRGSREEREDRAHTLVGVFQNAASLVIIVGSILVACEEVGIAIGPLMGGAAVFGLAVAFGAQNLIRDYFYGFMILLENQYKLNDVVKIGETSGQVERITLRVTVLRDLEGRVHFVPNGKIDAVTNMTHGWSRALFEIGVAYKEDADRVMQVLLDLAAELRVDPKFAPLILDDAEMLGVDSLGESSVNLKFFIKTRPLKQWAVKRELLRRIKRRFDEMGIEIPFPHRTVYHHQAASAGHSPVKPSDEEDWVLRQAG